MPDPTDTPPLALPEPRRLRSLAPLVAGFLLLVAVVAATGGIVGMQRMAAADMLRGFDQRNRIATLFSALQDAETGQRGYLLTGDASYLAPYENAVGRVEAGLPILAETFSADPGMTESVAKLRSVAAEKLAELRSTIELRRAGRTEESIAVVRADEGKRLMDEARVLLGRLGGAVADGLRER